MLPLLIECYYHFHHTKAWQAPCFLYQALLKDHFSQQLCLYLVFVGYYFPHKREDLGDNVELNKHFFQAIHISTKNENTACSGSNDKMVVNLGAGDSGEDDDGGNDDSGDADDGEDDGGDDGNSGDEDDDGVVDGGNDDSGDADDGGHEDDDEDGDDEDGDDEDGDDEDGDEDDGNDDW
jgi:hypothetical protein